MDVPRGLDQMNAQPDEISVPQKESLFRSFDRHMNSTFSLLITTDSVVRSRNCLQRKTQDEAFRWQSDNHFFSRLCNWLHSPDIKVLIGRTYGPAVLPYLFAIDLLHRKGAEQSHNSELRHSRLRLNIVDFFGAELSMARL